MTPIASSIRSATVTTMHNLNIIGILNTTPDSYWDGGGYMTVDTALKRAQQLIEEGADIIDVGGESTGPGSLDVSVTEELSRTIPVIQAIRSAWPKIQISIDTYKGEVADAALKAGAHMVNDVTAGRGDDAMFSIVAKHGAYIILMYAKDPTARTTKKDEEYDDVITTIQAFLHKRIYRATQEGIPHEHIVIDPGLGHFVSSNPKYSFEIIARMQEFASMNYPVCVSPSRKSFLAGEENLPTKDRLPGTIAASALAYMNGATYIRTHDVKEVRQGCEMTQEISSRIR